MSQTESVSKGCFAFKPAALSSKKSKVKVHDPLDEINNEEWYIAFKKIWSNINSKIDRLNESFSSSLIKDLAQFIGSCEYGSRLIPVAVLLTGINLPDHGSLFGLLKRELLSETTPHVAILSSECTSVRYLIESMVQKFIKTTLDVHEGDSDEEMEDDCMNLKKRELCLPHLEKWYNNWTPSPSKSIKSPKPKLVVIIPEFESFNAKALQEFLLILSGYIERLPFVVLFGVATSVVAVNNRLPHVVTSRLSFSIFQSPPSVHFLNTVAHEVFISKSCPFQLGGKLLKFLTDVFLFYDFSVHTFTQGIKYALMEHFYHSDTSLLCCNRKQAKEVLSKFTNSQVEEVRKLKSFRKYVESSPKKARISLLCDDDYTKNAIENLLSNLRDHLHGFHVCLKLLHILTASLPQSPLGKTLRELYVTCICENVVDTAAYKECFQLLEFQSKDELLQKFDVMVLILENEEEDESEIKAMLHTLHSQLSSAGQSKNLGSVNQSPTKAQLNVKNRAELKEALLKMGKVGPSKSEYEVIRSQVLKSLHDDIFEKYLIPPSSLPLHEIIICDRIKEIKRRIVGSQRAAVHTSLNNPHHYLRCQCCEIEMQSDINPSMPDVCVAYKLHLESGSLINTYDWLQSFRTVVCPESVDEDDPSTLDPKIQARFSQAVAELEFLGFIKSSKRKTDHVARLTWGGTS